MYAFQKERNIERQCIENSMLLRDFYLSQGINAKVKAVLSQYSENDEARLICHMIVEIGQGLIDPSYEIFRHDATYMDNICIVMKNIKKTVNSKAIEGISIKEVLTNFIKFIKIAERINNEEHDSFTDYNLEQLNYIKTSKVITLAEAKKAINELK